jgi:hypothetical protein
MSIQDILAYSLVIIMVAAFGYLAWASRKGKDSTKKQKE